MLASYVNLISEYDDHWIEIMIRDENNQPFNNVKGFLIDASHNKHEIIVGRESILITAIAAGLVKIILHSDEWIEQTHQRQEFDPHLEQEDLLQTWLAINPLGYQNTPRELISTTLGDFLDVAEKTEQAIASRHQAGALGKCYLASNSSYVIKIQGVNLVNLRLGLFFDRSSLVCSEQETQDTNVKKLFNLYQDNVFYGQEKVYVCKKYFQAIKITDHLTQIASLQIIKILANLQEQIFQTSQVHVDGIASIAFDLFGFSDGAVWASDFANEILANKLTEFAQNFSLECSNAKLFISSQFNWQNKYCKIMFVGLFDRVIPWYLNYMKEELRSDLNADKIEYAVHFLANKCTEYRHNFKVSLLNKAPNFIEINVAGSHGDVGGGYNIKDPKNNNEQKIIVKLIEGYKWYEYFTIKKRLEQKLELALNLEVKQGWPKQNLAIEIERQTRHKRTNKKITKLVGYLKYTSTINDDLSRLYLRMMFGLANHRKSMLREEIDGANIWQQEMYKLPEKLPYLELIESKKDINYYDFHTLHTKVLEKAKQGDIKWLQRSFANSDNSQLFFKLGLIHHCSDRITNKQGLKINRPHYVGCAQSKIYQRIEIKADEKIGHN